MEEATWENVNVLEDEVIFEDGRDDTHTNNPQMTQDRELVLRTRKTLLLLPFGDSLDDIIDHVAKGFSSMRPKGIKHISKSLRNIINPLTTLTVSKNGYKNEESRKSKNLKKYFGNLAFEWMYPLQRHHWINRKSFGFFFLLFTICFFNFSSPLCLNLLLSKLSVRFLSSKV